MELICGACHGRLLAELPGTTVACPHCGTHLQTPAAEPAPQPQGAVLIDSGDGSSGGHDPTTDPDPTTDTALMNLWIPSQAAHDATVTAEPFTLAPSAAATTAAPAAAARPSPDGPEFVAPAAEIPSPVAPANPAEDRGDSTVALPTAGNAGAASPASESAAPADELVDDLHKTTVVGFVVDFGNKDSNASAAAQGVLTADPTAASLGTTDSISAIIRAAESSASPGPSAAPGLPSPGLQSETSAAGRPARSVPARAPVRAGISPTLFVVVISYASAMTLACVYLAFLLLNNPRTLDLPDLAPPQPKDKKKVTALIYLSPDQEIPPANVLKLGQSRQYGSLKVTPLRVTRGPLAFEYYEPEAKQTRAPEGPVLKLHLRFENVSPEQEFIPLDSKLVFTKDIDQKSYGLLKANNFVCNVADRTKPAKLVYTFDLTPNGNWLLKGENLDREFEPGQVLETFIPTTPEQIESLSGDLVWRVHFRKGYNRKSFRGVTTLIEVLFKNSDIVDDAEPTDADPAPADSAPGEPAEEERAKQDPAVKDA